MTLTATTFAARKLGREAAVRKARALAQELRPYADDAEEARRIPSAAVDCLLRSGLIPLVRPQRWGGFDESWMTLVDCVSEVAKVSASIGWCFCFLMQHQWVLGYFSEEAQAAVYDREDLPRIVTSFGAFGRAERDGGGFRLSGDWGFGSGGDHCDWAIVGALVAGPEGGMRWFLLRPGQFHMRDTWHSVGLKGSGSNNIVVNDAFVPEAFTLDVGAAYAGDSPGAAFLTGPKQQAPLSSQFQFGLLAPMMGAARGAFETFVDFSRERRETMGGGKAADNPLLQVRVGEALAEIEAAYAVLQRIDAGVLSGELAKPSDGPRVGRDFALCAKLMVQAVDRLFAVSGARGLSELNPLGRHWRDIHAMSNHAALNSENMFQACGRQVLNGT